MSPPDLVPRTTFFGNPDRMSVRLSPDGRYLSWLAPVKGVLNVWVAPRTEPSSARPVTTDSGRGIRVHLWTHRPGCLLYLQDTNGDENWRVYCVDVEHDEITDLTPFDGVHAIPFAVSHHRPDVVLIGLNHRDPQWHDVYSVNLLTGDRELMYENNRFGEFSIDEDFRLRVALEQTSDGGVTLYRRTDDGDWVVWQSISREDAMTTAIMWFDESGDHAYVADSRDRDTAALFSLDMNTGERELLAEDSRADLDDIIAHPKDRHVQAASFTYERRHWSITDDAIRPDLEYLDTVVDGEIQIASRTLDDGYWIVSYEVDDGPLRYYLYDRNARRTDFLFSNRGELEGLPLAHMHSVVITARDGFDLVAYYTLPVDCGGDAGTETTTAPRPAEPLPMVFVPHGGPWSRDRWGYDSMHQWLANRGYAVLCVNFRSSTGFGKRFINAGDCEWAGAIHTDQVDAVRWAIEEGIADPERIAVMGGSFGGYSTLAGLTFSPGLFACGVDLFGPSNLVTLLETVPPYWKPMFETLVARVGDPRTDKGKALLLEHSPLTHVDRIRKPLLIGQGTNDPRVKRAESDQIVEAMNQKGIPVTYLLYSDEGHGFARPENRLSFYAVAEAFLSRCIGGRRQEVGEDFTGSTIEVIEGASEVPGLREAIESRVE